MWQSFTHSMHCIVCIVFYALYALYFQHCKYLNLILSHAYTSWWRRNEKKKENYYHLKSWYRSLKLKLQITKVWMIKIVCTHVCICTALRPKTPLIEATSFCLQRPRAAHATHSDQFSYQAIKIHVDITFSPKYS